MRERRGGNFRVEGFAPGVRGQDPPNAAPCSKHAIRWSVKQCCSKSAGVGARWPLDSEGMACSAPRRRRRHRLLLSLPPLPACTNELCYQALLQQHPIHMIASISWFASPRSPVWCLCMCVTRRVTPSAASVTHYLPCMAAPGRRGGRGAPSGISLHWGWLAACPVTNKHQQMHN